MEPLDWARREVDRLSKNEAGPAAARQFLRTHAGVRSAFVEQAKALPPHEHRAGKWAAIALSGWIDYVQSNMAEATPEATRFRVEAATDLMEQVQQLLSDRHVHPVAPVMLAGAALEEFLRGLIAQHPEAVVQGKPSIVGYGAALASIDAISRQSHKEQVALAGDRNDAAHGKFNDITADRARLMVDRVNFFMSKHEPSGHSEQSQG